MTAKSQSGWVITYAGCPITWSSKLQTFMALSTMEAEYVTLSSANRNMSKSKGWTLQSSLLMLGMDENSNQQSNKNC